MIQDLDGNDPGAARRGHVLVLSVVLVCATLVGWAAANSTAFQGPFATPHPSAAVRLYTPAPIEHISPAANFGTLGGGCVVPGGTYSTTVFVGGRTVAFDRPTTTNPLSWCAIFWADLSRQPWERILP